MPITRRGLLRSALAAPALIRPRRSLAWTHGSAHPPIPAPFSAKGFNSVVFFDDFLSTSTIDLADTGDPSKLWFIHNAWPNCTTPSGTLWSPLPTMGATPTNTISVANSAVTISTDITPGITGFQLCSARTFANAQGYVGRGFSGGAGYAFRAQFDPSLTVNNYRPLALWAAALEFLTGLVAQHTEVDFFELDNLGGNKPQANPVEWDMTAKTSALIGGVANLSGIIPLDALFHTYWFLWVPASKNGGTGLMQLYVDGVLAITINYSASTAPLVNGSSVGLPVGTYSDLDSQTMTLNFGAGQSVPLSVDYWMVCQ